MLAHLPALASTLICPLVCGLQKQHFGCPPTPLSSIVPHADVDFVQAASLPTVGSAVVWLLCCTRALGLCWIVGCLFPAAKHGIIGTLHNDVAEVESSTVKEHRHVPLLHDSAGCKVHLFKRPAQGQSHLHVAPYIIDLACGKQGAPEQELKLTNSRAETDRNDVGQIVMTEQIVMTTTEPIVMIWRKVIQ